MKDFNLSVEKEYIGMGIASVAVTHRQGVGIGYKSNGLTTITIKDNGGTLFRGVGDRNGCAYGTVMGDKTDGVDSDGVLVISISGDESIGLLRTIHETIGAMLVALEAVQIAELV